MMEDLNAQAAEVRRGGGEWYIEREHARGKRTAGARGAALIDEGSVFVEVGGFAGAGTCGAPGQ